MFKLKVLLRSFFGEGVWSVVQKMSMAPRHRLMRLVRRETQRTVQSGPFKGVIYLHDAASGGYVPKLLGIYERELHGVINALPPLGLQHIINIGASDGYYAVGLARLLPNVQVMAFEMEPLGQEFVRQIADQNGVGSRVVVRGHCDLSDLQAAVDQSGRTLIICDVEGFEDILLDPNKAPALKQSWILVELHDGKNAGVSDRVRNRFENTHTIETIWQEKRTAADFGISTPYTVKIGPQYLEKAVNEGRPVLNGVTPMSWFWMIPKASC